jgi:hypothetical protein
MQTRNMEKEFIPYEQALALKELGFDEPCFGRYIYDGRGKEWFLVQTQQTKSASVIFEGARSVDGISVAAPLYQQAFRWFREKYNLHAEPYTADMGAIEYCFQIRDLYSEKYIYDNFRGAGNSYMGTFNTPEEAELECLKKLIEIVKNG